MLPYETYSIDELADAYCDAVDAGNETLKSIYISALVLRFWHKIDKMYRSNTVAPCLEHEDFFWWLYEAIEYACKYRGWRDADKNLSAQQCINKCIETIKLQKYYLLRLDKNKTVNYCSSMETVVGESKDGDAMTLADMLEAEESSSDYEDSDVAVLVQDYINNNKIIEAILIDTIAFNDMQRYSKRVVKTTNAAGEPFKYTEYSSEFWQYKVIQTLNKLPATYKSNFMKRYTISEDKLTAVLNIIAKGPNVKLYKYLRNCLSELKESYCY
jgi:hypothetical protein